MQALAVLQYGNVGERIAVDRQQIRSFAGGEDAKLGPFNAFGGATGQLSHTRTYAGAGSFTLSLNVTDDDAGTTAQSVVVPILTAEQALVQVIQTLDQIIAGTTNAQLKKILLDARKALKWNGASGAIDKLRLKNPQAALVKLGQARDRFFIGGHPVSGVYARCFITRPLGKC